jgi:hypothetical protein
MLKDNHSALQYIAIDNVYMLDFLVEGYICSGGVVSAQTTLLILNFGGRSGLP